MSRYCHTGKDDYLNNLLAGCGERIIRGCRYVGDEHRAVVSSVRNLSSRPPMRTSADVRYRTGVLALCVLAYFGTRTSQLVVTPLVSEITTEFHVSKTVIGGVLTGMWMAYALVQFPSGVLSDRLGGRTVVLASLGITGVGSLLIAVAPAFLILAVLIVGLGAGAGIYYNAGTMLLTDLFDETGKAIGVHRIGGQLAGMVAPAAVVTVSVYIGWQSSLLLGLATTAPVFVLFATYVSPSPATRTPGTLRDRFDRSLITRLGTDSTLRYLTVIAVLSEFVGLATMSFLPTFLVEAREMTIGQAGILFSAYFGVVAVAQPLVGWVGSRLGNRRAVGLALFAGTAGFFALTAKSSLVALAGLVSVGLAMGWVSPVQAAIITALPTADRGTGFGVFRTVYVLLGSLGSVIVGFVADVSTWVTAFWLLACLLYTGLLLTVVSELLHSEHRFSE